MFVRNVKVEGLPRDCNYEIRVNTKKPAHSSTGLYAFKKERKKNVVDLKKLRSPTMDTDDNEKHGTEKDERDPVVDDKPLRRKKT